VNTLHKGDDDDDDNNNKLSNVDCQRDHQCHIAIYEPQSVSENSNYKLYYDRSVTTNQTIHYNRLDTRVVLLYQTIKEAHSIHVAIPNSHNLHSAITEKLQKYTGLKEGLTRIRQLKMAHIILSALSTADIMPNKLCGSLKLLNLCQLYIF
jgi:hypothetical protein